MNENQLMMRARMLIGQSRYELAEEQLRLALAHDPSLAAAHALLAICLTKRERFEEATAEAQQAIHHAPDEALGHYALAFVMIDRNRLKEARTAINEAIRLQPWDADYFSLLASIEAHANDYQAMLAAAEQGLAEEPDHEGCNNFRAIALTKLGRRDEAGISIQETLRRDPENPVTHANEGWRLLHARNPNEAMRHFQEALRLDPTSEWARQGIIEAMKARHFIYRWMLSFFLWINGFTPKIQAFILIGFVVAQNLLPSIARSITGSEDAGEVILGVLLLFAWMTWTSSTLFNLVLMTSRFGRLALNSAQKLEAGLSGGCIVMCFVWIGIHSLQGTGWLGVNFPRALLNLGVIIPIVTVFHTPSHVARRRQAAIAWTIGVLLVVTIANYQATKIRGEFEQLYNDLSTEALEALGRQRDQNVSLSGPEDLVTQLTALAVKNPDSVQVTELNELKMKARRQEISQLFLDRIRNLSKWSGFALWGVVLSTWLGTALQWIPARR